MKSVELLRLEAAYSFGEMVTAIEGVDQPQAWGILPNLGPDYLNTSASIQGMVLHVATAKILYGSVGFRSSEIRWRDVASEVEPIEQDWERSVAYLHRAHQYWLETWEGLTDAELAAEVPHFSGKLWPAWKVIYTVTEHDSYHAGQIAVLRYGVGPGTSPPPSEAEDIRRYCADLPSW